MDGWMDAAGKMLTEVNRYLLLQNNIYFGRKTSMKAV